jgi:hypothetical protein
MLPFPGSLLLLRWALHNYPELWLLIGPLLVCFVLLVLGSWWQMVFPPPPRRYVPRHDLYDAADWDQG